MTSAYSARESSDLSYGSSAMLNSFAFCLNGRVENFLITYIVLLALQWIVVFAMIMVSFQAPHNPFQSFVSYIYFSNNVETNSNW